mmetsp:Transcript_12812/g.21688  ORF Transcript_12812/g.21688 Transcript_12812/m.21688 type:complete len:146 (+) Transcript_12812:853-1290(+)
MDRKLDRIQQRMTDHANLRDLAQKMSKQTKDIYYPLSEELIMEEKVTYTNPEPDEAIMIKGVYRESIGRPRDSIDGANSQLDDQRFYNVDLNQSQDDRPLPALMNKEGSQIDLDNGESLQARVFDSQVIPDSEADFNVQKLDPAD